MKNFKTYLGTAATMTLGLGCVPKFLRVINLATGLAPVYWSEGMLANSAVAGGIIDVAGTYTPQTQAQGVCRYFGGDVVTSKSNNVVVDPGLQSSLKTNYQGSATIFTMDTVAAGTGHFDVAGATGYGAGSVIMLAYIDTLGRPASWTGRIAAVGTATSANGVTLDTSAPNIGSATTLNPLGGARIVYIGPAYDLIAAPVGTTMPAGVKLFNVTYMTPAVQLLIEWDDNLV